MPTSHSRAGWWLQPWRHQNLGRQVRVVVGSKDLFRVAECLVACARNVNFGLGALIFRARFAMMFPVRRMRCGCLMVPPLPVAAFFYAPNEPFHAARQSQLRVRRFDHASFSPLKSPSHVARCGLPLVMRRSWARHPLRRTLLRRAAKPASQDAS
jgi:hypothetical protein